MHTSENQRERPKKLHSFFFLALFTILYLTLRLPHISDSLWFDETWFTRYHLGSLSQLWRKILFEIHPPLPYLYMYSWITLFGDSIISVRSTSLLCGAASIVMTFLVARQFSLSKASATYSSLLLCLSPTHIWYSQEARPYMALALMLLTAIYAFNRILQGNATRRWYWLYFTSIFSLSLTHYYAGFCLIVFSIELLRRAKREQIILVGSLHFLVIASLAACLLLKLEYGSVSFGEGYLRRFTLFELWMVFLHWFPTGNSLMDLNPYITAHRGFRIYALQPWLLPLHLFTGCIMIRGAVDLYKVQRASLLVLMLFSLPAVLFIFGLLGFKHTYIERSVFCLLPIFCITFARGFTTLTNRHVRDVATAAVLFLWVACLCGFYQKRDSWTVYKPRPDWQSALAFITARAEGAACVYAVIPSDDLVVAASRRNKIRYAQVQDLAQIEKKLPQGVQTFFLVLNTHWVGGFHLVLKQLLDSGRYRVVEEVGLRGVRVHWLARVQLTTLTH
jgi:4-amino-4-deoxy-L-arabinose transferase-like glycosyltransferase